MHRGGRDFEGQIAPGQIVPTLIGCPGVGFASATSTVLVTQQEITSLLGTPELTFESTGDECLWTARAPDRSTWSLRLRVKDMALIRKPYIFVTKPSIYYNGQPDPDNPIVEHITLGQARAVLEASDSEGCTVAWHHAKKYIVHLELMCEGRSAPSPRTKIVEMKQLAHAVEARLANP